MSKEIDYLVWRILTGKFCLCRPGQPEKRTGRYINHLFLKSSDPYRRFFYV